MSNHLLSSTRIAPARRFSLGTRRRACATWRRQRGVTLVELLVGVVIGLLAILVVSQVALVYEGQKRSTTSGSDAQINGALALQAIQRDVQSAGYGPTSGLAALFTQTTVDASGCAITAKADGATPAGAPTLLAPVVIDVGANGAPDTLHVFASGNSNFSLPIALGSNHSTTDTYFVLKAGGSTGNLPGVNIGNAQGDLMLAVSADTAPPTCTLFGINVDGMTPSVRDAGGVESDGVPLGTVANGTPLVEAAVAPAGAVSVGRRIGHAGADSGAGIWNKAVPLLPNAYTADRTYLVNLGRPADVIYRSYAVGNQGLTLTEFDFAAGSAKAATEAYAGIVLVKAVYGKALANNNMQADTWVSSNPGADVVTDAAGNAMNGWSRVVAVRVVMVARSQQYEKTEVTTVLPKWYYEGNRAGNSMDLKIDANPDWKHYRYKVYETVIPLRNMIWQS